MKTQGIVINSIDYKEASKIVYLYTPLGKVSIRAIGANKPKNGLLGFTTTLNIVSFVATDSNFPKLSEYTIEKSIFSNTESIDFLNAIQVILDVIKYLPDDINHEATYNFIRNVILGLSTNPKKILSIYLIKMLYVFGVAPNLKTCSICENLNPTFFKVSNGGAICNNCISTMKYPWLLEAWREYYYKKKDFNEYNDYDFDILLKSIESFYNVHAHIKLNI